MNGNGVNPGLDDLLAVAKRIGLNVSKAKKEAVSIQECVSRMLEEYI